jgi:hypothetical protein
MSRNEDDMAWFLLCAVAAVVAWGGFVYLCLAFLRGASRPTPKPEGLVVGADVASRGESPAAVEDGGGAAQGLQGDSEERVDGYYTTNFFI